MSREICRNGGRERYRADLADQAAWERAHRPKTCKLVENRTLARIVANKLRLAWSPEQIAGWLKRTHPGDESDQVSHKTIYRSLFIQARGALKKELLQHLRRTRAMRRSRHHTQKRDGHGRITDTVSIRERPALVEDRAVPGHWEGDLVSGSNNSHIATLVERYTRYVMLAKVNGKDTETVINALIKQAHKLPKELYRSLTWDRGKEMAPGLTIPANAISVTINPSGEVLAKVAGTIEPVNVRQLTLTNFANEAGLEGIGDNRGISRTFSSPAMAPRSWTSYFHSEIS